MLQQDLILPKESTSDSANSGTYIVYTPPGIALSTAKYPILNAGFLGTDHPFEHTSIFDYPSSWYGLDVDSILSMRRLLYRFVFPVNAKALSPQSLIEKLQHIALSVIPVAIGVEGPTLPPRHLQPIPGELPAGLQVAIKSFELLSEPEISLVAKKISERDIPTVEAVNKLFSFDYTLEEVSRLIAVGLLGQHTKRRLVPMRSARKIAIDAFIDHAIISLIERSSHDSIRFWQSNILGDSFLVMALPGEPRVDYLHIESGNEIRPSFSFEHRRFGSSDAKAANLASFARFSAYREMMKRNEASHYIVFHKNLNSRNNMLGPWIVEAGIQQAFCREVLEIDNHSNLENVFNAIMDPKLDVWKNYTPLDKILGSSLQLEQFI